MCNAACQCIDRQLDEEINCIASSVLEHVAGKEVTRGVPPDIVSWVEL